MESEAAQPVQEAPLIPNMPQTSADAACDPSKMPDSKSTGSRTDPSKAHPALAELNSKLYARGLTRSGIKLDGLNSKAQDQVVKVISKLLSQRAVRPFLEMSRKDLLNYDPISIG